MDCTTPADVCGPNVDIETTLVQQFGVPPAEETSVLAVVRREFTPPFEEGLHDQNIGVSRNVRMCLLPCFSAAAASDNRFPPTVESRIQTVAVVDVRNNADRNCVPVSRVFDRFRNVRATSDRAEYICSRPLAAVDSGNRGSVYTVDVPVSNVPKAASEGIISNNTTKNLKHTDIPYTVVCQTSLTTFNHAYMCLDCKDCIIRPALIFFSNTVQETVNRGYGPAKYPRINTNLPYSEDDGPSYMDLGKCYQHFRHCGCLFWYNKRLKGAAYTRQAESIYVVEEDKFICRHRLIPPSLCPEEGIAPVAIIDRQLPFEYTITSRSTDVVVMTHHVQNINHSAFRSMFEREKLSGNNFNDWFRQLKLVLRVEKKMFVIEQPLPAAPAANSEAQVLLEWNAVYDAYNEVACLILGSMTAELHRQFENSSPYDMIKELKAMFEKQAGVERFDLIQTFHACKQEEGKPVAAYVIQMKGYVDQLERLGYVLPQDLIVGLILNGLTKDFSGFVRNYNMHNMGKTVGELHAMLIEYEKGLPKKAETPQVMMIKGGKIQKANKKSLKVKGKGKANGKGKDKQVYIPKPKNPKPSAKEHPAKDDACHHCKEVGHWKRNCPVYLAELLKKKKQVGSASSSGIFTIELFAFPNKSWVYDTGCGTHICITKQGFREARKLKQGALYLYVGNGVRAQVEAIGSYDLVLPNDLVICLDNCHYAPSITRDVVLVHRLKRIEKLQQEGLLKSTDDESFDQCVSCLSDKMTRKSFLHRPERVTDLFGIIHIDVCGPLRHVSRQCANYFITFTADYSRYGYVYLLKHKHEVFETFKVFKNEVENQLGKTIKALRSDRGGEYISQEFKDYLKACGIVQQLTPPYTPQHNGDYALEFATRILNMVPTKKVDKTLYELWYEKVPNMSYLKVWGCEALVKRDTPDKLQQRSVKCIFIGYPKETMGYYFYFPPENKIVVARYAEFFEKNLITQEVSGRAMDLEEIQDEDTSPFENTSKIPMEVEGFEPPQEEEIPIRRSERTRQAPNHLCLNVEAEEHSLRDLNEPTSYKATILDSESNKWIDVINAKIQSMMDNMVWVLVDLPPGCKTVGSKWIFKKKTDTDGIVHTYKACLVAKGYTQLYGVDHEETFSPITDIRAIRILISITAYYDYEIWQMDIKTAFLNGYLDEDIYMVQPEGFVDPNHPRKVCKLQRSIYGLKQASRSWNKKFDEEIKRFGFAQNLDEPCVYQKASRSDVTFLILYVDDIIIMGNHISSLQSVKDYLGKCFAMKDLGEAAFILGIKIYRDRSKRLIGLGQNAYMDKILKRYKMDNFKRGYIPMQERLDLNKTQGASTPEEVKHMQNVPYASAVGSIMYAVRCTRSDVAFAQNITSRFQQNLGECHWTAVKNILKYLRKTKSKPEPMQWSATEAEAASEATMEVVWIRKFISGLDDNLAYLLRRLYRKKSLLNMLRAWDFV
ncbi:retrotransposon protein, putative, ty1-copia subclass [Tanacetum coccineum]|uniref:Retrotransposon protein, putative, ty1-copia subclass n=1 Tax=Tanacetum coccineum TaxID=301880 RepID=A0ABQ5C847_9ASTR